MGIHINPNPGRFMSVERLRSMTISPLLTIRQTIQHMNDYGHRAVYIVKNNTRLIGAVTDGDIRRWILKDGSLRKPISLIMNRKPIFIKEGESVQLVKQKMAAREIHSIPVLNDSHTIIGIYLWADFFEQENVQYEKLDIPVVIMAGGGRKALRPNHTRLTKTFITNWR